MLLFHIFHYFGMMKVVRLNLIFISFMDLPSFVKVDQRYLNVLTSYTAVKLDTATRAVSSANEYITLLLLITADFHSHRFNCNMLS